MSPNSGNHIANGEGFHREVESEGRRRQISGLTNRKGRLVSIFDVECEDERIAKCEQLPAVFVFIFIP